MAILEEINLNGLDVNDYLTWYVSRDPEFQFTPAKKKLNWSGSALADGEALVGNEDHYGNAEMVFGAATFPQSDRDAAARVLDGLTNRLQEARRTPGGMPMAWTPAGSSFPLTWYVLEAEYEVINATRDGGWFDNAPSVAVHLYLRPFGYAAEQVFPLGYTDPFKRDTWTGGPWRFAAGTASDVVWYGGLVTATTGTKRLFLPFTATDFEATMHLYTSTTLTNLDIGVAARQGGGNHLRATLTATQLKITKVVGATTTDLATTAFTPVGGTWYWMRFTMDGDELQVDLYDDASDPNSGNPNLTPLATLPFTLGAGDAVLGATVRGNPGIYLTPGSVGASLIKSFQLREMQDIRSGEPMMQFEIPNVPGHVPAEARQVVTEESGKSRAHFESGRETRDYDPADAPKLILDSEQFVTLGLAGTPAAVAGAYSPVGSGNNAVTSPILSTSVPLTVFATPVLTHVGIFKVRIRAKGSAGVMMRWAWRVGDGRFDRTPYVRLPSTAATSDWYDLEFPAEMVIPRAAVGAQSWDGRLEAYSPDVQGGTISADYVMFIPMENYSVISIPVTPQVPTTFAILEEFNQGSPTLNGAALPLGGTWATSGDAGDFAIDTIAHRIDRTAFDPDMATGRYAIASAGPWSAIQMQGEVWMTPFVTAGGDFFRQGVIVHYTDINNWVMAVIQGWGTGGSGVENTLRVFKKKTGTITQLGSKKIPNTETERTMVVLSIDATGLWGAYVYKVTSKQPSKPTITGFDADLASTSGLAVAAGKVGFYDAMVTPALGTITRHYDNPLASVPVTPDAVLYANRHLEVRTDRAERENASGASKYAKLVPRGTGFVVPSAGAEGHISRVVSKARRGNIDEGQQDTFISDTHTVQIYGKARYLHPSGGG